MGWGGRRPCRIFRNGRQHDQQGLRLQRRLLSINFFDQSVSHPYHLLLFFDVLSMPFFYSLVMRAAANKPNINIVAVNDPFIPVNYMEYMYK